MLEKPSSIFLNHSLFLPPIVGIEPCAVGSTVEVLINPHHAARPELLEVE